MNPKLKAFLIISAKQAVGAVIGNGVLAATMPKTFNVHSWTAFGWATLSLVLAAEGKAWLPKILAWTNSPTPDAELK